MKKARVFESCRGLNSHVAAVDGFEFRPDDKGHEMHLLQVFPFVQEQTMEGFGGAFSQSAAEVYLSASPASRQQLLKDLFSAEGLAYTCGRIPIGACDFSSRGEYSYRESPDAAFDEAALAEEPMITLVRDAKGLVPELELIAAPWSPPAWMKTNGEMLHGGKLKPELRKEYAAYLADYVVCACALGLPVRMISVQNEPKAVQPWESCLYTAREEGEFIRDFLVPALRDAGVGDVDIYVWDHNKERVFSRVRELMAMEGLPELITGVAFHWYSGDHFENVELCRRFFPQLKFIFTEGCVELCAVNTIVAEKAQELDQSRSAQVSPWGYGEMYAHDMFGNLNAGMCRYTDWNMILNEKGGPNHVNNFCSAPIMFNAATEEIIHQPTYDYIAHFSRYIPAGSRRVAISRYSPALEASAFITPKNELVLVAMNATDREIPMIVSDEGAHALADWSMKPHSIITAVWPAD